MYPRYLWLFLLPFVSCAIAACAKHKLKDKQIQWRTECEQMMLKGAEALIAHHDCYNRCIQHYRHYCFTRCEMALLDGKAKQEEVDKTCKKYLQSYITKKCHYLCELSQEELQEYRLNYVKRMHETTYDQSGCKAWDRSDEFMSKIKKKKNSALDDSYNQFRQPYLDKRQEERKRAKSMIDDLPWLYQDSSTHDVDDSLSSDDDNADEDNQDNSDDDDQDLNTADQEKEFTKGFQPVKKISIQGDAQQLDAFFEQLNQSRSSNKVNQGQTSSPMDSAHSLENEIIQSRDTLQAVKDIKSLLKK